MDIENTFNVSKRRKAMIYRKDENELVYERMNSHVNVTLLNRTWPLSGEYPYILFG